MRRDGFRVRLRREERLNHAEGLVAHCRGLEALMRIWRKPPPERANAHWMLDVLEHSSSGRTIRLQTVIGVITRETLALEVGCSLLERVCCTRPPASARHGRCQPNSMLDNGSERISRVVATRPNAHGVALHVIDPDKPIQNAHCESFHGRLRHERLNERCY